ncbi:hypothetical protein Pelo_13719 [Pelomyxa schiedti]|nr:hypothetical protein Pelo_13719 [Pelomyxa schiedti]
MFESLFGKKDKGAAPASAAIAYETTFFTLVANDNRRWAMMSRVKPSPKPATTKSSWFGGGSSSSASSAAQEVGVVPVLTWPEPSLPLYAFVPIGQPPPPTPTAPKGCAKVGDYAAIWGKNPAGIDYYLHVMATSAANFSSLFALEWKPSTQAAATPADVAFRLISSKPTGTPLSMLDGIVLESCKFPGAFIVFDSEGFLKIAPAASVPPSRFVIATHDYVAPSMPPPSHATKTTASSSTSKTTTNSSTDAMNAAVAAALTDAAKDRYTKNPELIVDDAAKLASVASSVANNPTTRKAASGLFDAILSSMSKS